MKNEKSGKFGYEVLAHIPMDPRLAALSDKGMLELFENNYLDGAADKLEKMM